jgi:hypothetical protein
VKKKFLMFLTRHMKPCHFFSVAKGPKKDYVNCGAYHAYRNRCKTWQCPHFAPTIRYRIARWLGMVKH